MPLCLYLMAPPIDAKNSTLWMLSVILLVLMWSTIFICGIMLERDVMSTNVLQTFTQSIILWTAAVGHLFTEDFNIGERMAVDWLLLTLLAVVQLPTSLSLIETIRVALVGVDLDGYWVPVNQLRTQYWALLLHLVQLNVLQSINAPYWIVPVLAQLTRLDVKPHAAWQGSWLLISFAGYLLSSLLLLRVDLWPLLMVLIPVQSVSLTHWLDLGAASVTMFATLNVVAATAA